MFRSTLISSALLVASVTGLQAAFTEFTEDFNNLDDWTAGSNGTGALAPSVSSGVVTLSSGGTVQNALSTIRSLDVDFNPFEQAYSVALSGIGFQLNANTGNGRNVGFLLIGRAQTSTSGGISGVSNYSPNTTPNDGLAMLNVQMWNIGGTLSISVGSKATAGNFDSMGRTTISGIPTDLTFSLTPNGTTSLLDWTIELTGATFTGSASNIASGSFDSTVTMASMQDAYISTGAYNNYVPAPTGPAVLTLDSLSVAAIPEVSQASLLLGASMLGLALCARRRNR